MLIIFAKDDTDLICIQCRYEAIESNANKLENPTSHLILLHPGNLTVRP